MSKPNETVPAAKTALPSVLLDKWGTPLFWLGVGYALGFFHGNSSGKRKSQVSAP